MVMLCLILRQEHVPSPALHPARLQASYHRHATRHRDREQGMVVQSAAKMGSTRVRRLWTATPGKHGQGFENTMTRGSSVMQGASPDLPADLPCSAHTLCLYPHEPSPVHQGTATPHTQHRHAWLSGKKGPCTPTCHWTKHT
jgi:hypothetical protein